MSWFAKFLYLEFLFPVKDYFITLKLKEFLFDWVFPLFGCLAVYGCFFINISFKDTICFNGYVINSLAILIGFSITCLTILATSGNDNVKQLRDVEIDRKIGNKKLSLYQLIFITFSFVLIMEITTLVLNLLYFLIYSSLAEKKFFVIIFLIINFLLFHIIFLNIRNITNFYFIFWRKSSFFKIKNC